MKTVTVTYARRQLSALLEDTTANEPVILQRDGEPVGVLMSYQNFESLCSLDRSINQSLLNDPVCVCNHLRISAGYRPSRFHLRARTGRRWCSAY